MKKVLGLDIGTNSIGWAVVETDLDTATGKIDGLGVRILPTDSELLSKYEAGQAASKNAIRRQARGARRLKQRYKLRRQRLIDSLKILGWLPENFQPGHLMPPSASTLQEMKSAFGTNEISEDWVVYFLRHKALTEQISKEELARVLYHMNQRRGFKSNRKSPSETILDVDDNGESPKKRREKKVEIVKVLSIEDTGEKTGGFNIFNITLSDGRKGTIAKKLKPEWENRDLELEITTIPPTKKDPARFEFRSLNNTDADNWAKQKIAREEDIKRSGLLFPGTYYYHALKKDPRYVLKDVSIDRTLYISELEAIFAKQLTLNPALDDRAAIASIAEMLYKKNLEKQREIQNNSIAHLFLKDIIYYQRPLKTKKSSIADCRLAMKNYADPKTGKKVPYKVAPVSSPAFQEFRIWQTVNNIRVLERTKRDAQGRPAFDVDVSQDYLHTSALESLFELFDSRERVSQAQILRQLGLSEGLYSINLYRQNETKELPGNETKAIIRKQFKKAGLDCSNILDNHSRLYLLWHILYSLEDNSSVSSALQRQFEIPPPAAKIIADAPALRQAYSSISHQAMSRMLPLMRSGKYWSWDAIDPGTRSRLGNILSGEFDEGISDQVRELFRKYKIEAESDCQGMMVPMASYSVYGTHSERDNTFYLKPDQILPSEPLNLRNPIVEQVVNETLRVVRDIWNEFGRPTEIHIELSRELKKNAKERQEIMEKMAENENENRRIAAILRELKLGNPNSFADIERLKLWEKQADPVAREDFKNVRFKRPSEPTREEIQKYKLWSAQKFLSPYSGRPIPISKLFSREYDIDHIIPRSRYFDDSLENKVVVETHLNKDKGNMTAFEYIRSGSNHNDLLSPSAYEAHVNLFFFRKKRVLLLSEDVPSSFSNRQLVDTRYITRKLHELLSPIAENRQNPVVPTSGKITNELKSAFGLAEKMKELVKWRFERIEEKTKESYVWDEEETDQDGKPTGRRILRLKGYEKRIDHRHHAMDALVIACTSLSHIKYLNDLNASQYKKSPTDQDLKHYLPKLLQLNGNSDHWQSRKFRKPWPEFTRDALKALEGIIISFRNINRIYGQKANKNWRFIEQPDGSFKRCFKPVTDQNGKPILSPYIRQSLHKATVAGKIILSEYEAVSVSEVFKAPDTIASKSEKLYIKELIKQAGGDLKKAIQLYKENPLRDANAAQLTRITCVHQAKYYANRVDLASGFDAKRIAKIPDPTLRRQLLNHIERVSDINSGREKHEQIEPFGAEGMELLNKGRRTALSKVTTKEESQAKFEIRPGAFVEADKGTNLFFVVYENKDDQTDRKFESIPLRKVVEAKSEGSGFVEEKPGYWWFTLSPNDLVYMPEDGERISGIDWKAREKLAAKVYKLVSCNKGQAFFVPQTVSKVILDKVEFDSMNKVERGLDGRMIKQHCIKLSVDRLGNIKPAHR